MPKQIKTTKKVHHFTYLWMQQQNNLFSLREAICLACNWSVSTFYNKLTLGGKNMLELTAEEETKIFEILNNK